MVFDSSLFVAYLGVVASIVVRHLERLSPPVQYQRHFTEVVHIVD